MSDNSRLKARKIIGQRKAFYSQRIPEPSCARKETVDILVTSRNGDRKIMQSIRYTRTFQQDHEHLTINNLIFKFAFIPFGYSEAAFSQI